MRHIPDLLRRRQQRSSEHLDHTSRLVIFGLVFTSTLHVVPPALAEGEVGGMLALFDHVDSHGVALSQYQLSLEMGGVTNIHLMPIAEVVQMGWGAYVWWIGMVGWLADWILQMDWVPYIVGPLAEVTQRLHDNLLAPLGLTSMAGQGIMGVLLAFAAYVGARRMETHGAAAGVLSWLTSALALVLAVGAFALPVASMAGTSDGLAKPLIYARGVALQLAAEVQGKDVDLYGDQYDVMVPGEARSPSKDEKIHVLQVVPDNIKVSTMLTETLVRPAHQMLNYGSNIDVDKCSNGSPASNAYDAALKKGPYWDMSDDSLRNAMGDCKKVYKDYASHPNNWWIATMVLFGIAGFLLGMVVLWFIYIVCRCVVSLLWGAIKTTYQAIAAIATPAAWGGLSQSLMECGAALWLMVTNVLVFVVVLMMARGALTAEDLDLNVRFILVDIVLLLGALLLGDNYIQTLRGRDGLARKMAQKITGSTAAKRDWRQAGRDALLGYTAYNELAEKRAALRATQAPRAVEGSTRPSGPGAPAQSVGRIGRVKQSVKGAVSAAAGGAVGVAKAAKDGVQGVTSEVGQISHGKEVTGARKVLVPAAAVQARVRSLKNEQLNKASKVAVSLEEQRGAARAGADRAELPTSGSRHADGLARRAGRAQGKVERGVENVTEVVQASRYQGKRRESTPTTGHRAVDKTLGAVGATLRGVDKGSEVYHRPVSIDPGVDRVRRQDLRGEQGGVQGTRRPQPKRTLRSAQEQTA